MQRIELRGQKKNEQNRPSSSGGDNVILSRKGMNHVQVRLLGLNVKLTNSIFNLKYEIK